MTGSTRSSPPPAPLGLVTGGLVCRSTPQGLQPDPPALGRVQVAPRTGARRPR
uniref:Uncharacterized protein n=1 Tax=Thermogemmatispora argillosa TaxID=2045280 RepID=A0A455SYM0_9CHLR|nr:hypothetical protein KTA_04500 [Thermogemmatispora argillosa]